jgi:uncharacterized protein YdeI (YjbR/CyaY-like superfamily)
METLYIETRSKWREWLGKNQFAVNEIWLIYYKKHTGRKSVPYEASVEEALCFGWIDSIIKRLDGERYLRKFTPRTNTTNWSELNKRLATSLIKTGRMTEAGLNKIDLYLQTGKVEWEKHATSKEKRTSKGLVMPEEILRVFSEQEPALDHFNGLPPSHKRQYIGWITSAKREETRKRRIAEAIKLLKKNQPLGLR